MRDDLMQIAKNIAESSGGRIRLAFQEDDDSNSHVPDAAHFLKLDEKRIGRDLELYGFMSEIQGEQTTLAMFVEEVILPVKAVSESYKVAVDAMKTLGRRVYPAEMIDEWDAIFEG